eukprot:1137379-Pelagomonas_calceolata.AAC.5
MEMPASGGQPVVLRIGMHTVSKLACSGAAHRHAHGKQTCVQWCCASACTRQANLLAEGLDQHYAC